MLKKKEVTKEFELLSEQRKKLYQNAVGECPNCQESAETQIQKLKSERLSSLDRIYLYNYNLFLEHDLRNKAFVTIGNIVVDTITSDSNYICKCTKCGESWKVSKKQLEKEALRIDKQIAKANGDKKYGFVSWLKENRYLICLFISLSMCFISLILAFVSYFG